MNLIVTTTRKECPNTRTHTYENTNTKKHKTKHKTKRGQKDKPEKGSERKRKSKRGGGRGGAERAGGCRASAWVLMIRVGPHTNHVTLD